MSKSLTCILAVALCSTAAIPASADPSAKTVFVTSTSFAGSLGGLEGADAKCQAEAEEPGSIVPAGTYRAWLSDGVDSPTTRFNKSFGTFVLPDGSIIADDFLDLTHGHIQHEINVDSTGKRLGRALFWTGTKADGTSASTFVTCEGWTTERDSGGVAGSTLETEALWTQYRGGLPCNRSARLVCFGQ